MLYIHIFQEVAWDYSVGTVFSLWALLPFRKNRFFKVLNFYQIKIDFDFWVEWTRIERVVQKVDNNQHEAAFIAIDILKETFLVTQYLRWNESYVFLFWDVVQLQERLLNQSQQIIVILVEPKAIIFDLREVKRVIN